jgi:hypothetical protein
MKRLTRCPLQLLFIISSRESLQLMVVLAQLSTILKASNKFQDLLRSNLVELTNLKTIKKLLTSFGVILMRMKRRMASSITLCETLKNRTTWCCLVQTICLHSSKRTTLQ